MINKVEYNHGEVFMGDLMDAHKFQLSISFIGGKGHQLQKKFKKKNKIPGE